MTTDELAKDEVPAIVGFDGFYRTHRDRLSRALDLTIRDSDLATEAIDEAMAKAAQRWDVIGSYDSPDGWVYRVALNWARSVFRRRRPLPWRGEALWDSLPDPDVSRLDDRGLSDPMWKHAEMLRARDGLLEIAHT